MDLFRLTYFNCDRNEVDKWNSTSRFEIYGSAEAIINVYQTFEKLYGIQSFVRENWGDSPRFIEIYSKDGQNLTEEFKKHGLMGLYGNSNNTFK